MSQENSSHSEPADSELGVKECMCDRPFMSRVQPDQEDWMQYLTALECLRTQGFPEEPIKTRHYEILQRFTDSVRDPTMRQKLAVV